MARSEDLGYAEARKRSDEIQLFPLFFFGAKKRGKRNIHPNPSFPYMGRLN